MWGLVQPDDGISANGIRFTSEFILACERHNILPQYVDLRIELSRLFRKCELGSGGLLQRTPDGKWGQEGPDDYVAAIAADRVLRDGFADRFLEYGKANLWNYNNVNPSRLTPSSFLGRQWQIMVHAKIVADKELTRWDKLWWCGTVIKSAFGKKSDQDNWVLAWFLVKTLTKKQVGGIMETCAAFWRRKFRAKWPHGIGEVLADYFNNPSHPSVKYLWDEFGD